MQVVIILIIILLDKVSVSCAPLTLGSKIMSNSCVFDGLRVGNIIPKILFSNKIGCYYTEQTHIHSESVTEKESNQQKQAEVTLLKQSSNIIHLCKFMAQLVHCAQFIFAFGVKVPSSDRIFFFYEAKKWIWIHI